MVYVLTKHGTDKETNNVTWSEYLEIFDSSMNYNAFVAFPFCKYEIRDAIEKRNKWKIGLMGMVYVENAPIHEVLYCLAFARAYRKVYERKTPDPLANINLLIEEFLDMVDDETQVVQVGLQEKYAKYTDRGEINNSTVLTFILKTEAFKTQSFEN